jgi:serine/threonine protein phosphatase PrpC
MLRVAESISRTDTGRQRRGNEDSSYVHAPVFVVADGMGGARAGEVASHIAVQAFEQGLPEEGSPEERLSIVVQRANREIHDASVSEQERAGMGTTITAAFLNEDAVTLAHVGDSRAYLLRDDILTRLTDDHSLVEELVRGGKLTEEEALDHPQRSIITRALGPEPIVEVDTLTYPLRPGDVILLCSDGLTSMIPERQVELALVQSGSLGEGAKRLIDEANAAGGRDNITVVLFRVEEAGDGSAPVDQPTMITPAPETEAYEIERPTRREAGSAAGPAGPEAVTRPFFARPAPLARTQGRRAAPRGERRVSRLARASVIVMIVGTILFVLGAAAYLGTRNLYFIGTNGQGTVVVFRGAPYTLPFGIPAYETFYVSGVPAATIPKDRRATILNHAIHGQNAAAKLINDLELCNISG